MWQGPIFWPLILFQFSLSLLALPTSTQLLSSHAKPLIVSLMSHAFTSLCDFSSDALTRFEYSSSLPSRNGPCWKLSWINHLYYDVVSASSRTSPYSYLYAFLVLYFDFYHIAPRIHYCTYMVISPTRLGTPWRQALCVHRYPQSSST